MGAGVLIVPILGAIVPIMGTVNSSVNIADALFAQVRQRVLGILFAQPERSFYANELVRLAGSGIGAVQRELESLSSSGLLNVTRLGNQKHYQANQQSPIFAELCAIVTKTFGVADVLRAALLPLVPQIELALLYGSMAKGQAHANSDVDLMVVTDALNLEDIFAAIGPAELKLGRRINPCLYTGKEFRHRRAQSNPFLAKVLSGDIIVLSGSLDAVSRA